MKALNVVVNYAWIVLVGLCCGDVWLGNKLDSCFVGTASALLNQNMLLPRWLFVVGTL